MSVFKVHQHASAASKSICFSNPLGQCMVTHENPSQVEVPSGRRCSVLTLSQTEQPVAAARQEEVDDAEDEAIDSLAFLPAITLLHCAL